MSKDRHAQLGISEDTMIVEREGWRTPLTGITRRHGSIRLAQTHYRGVYHAEGLGGAKYMYIPNWLPVTVLQEHKNGGWADWMVDDPLHWIGMGNLVRHLRPGPVVCAGLGLGLMLHHMAQRPDLTEIRVIERNPDVIDVILPTLPPDPRVTIHQADFYRFVQTYPDPGASVLWDLAVGPGESLEVQAAFMTAEANVGTFWPTSKLFIHGDRQWVNPPETNGDA